MHALAACLAGLAMVTNAGPASTSRIKGNPYEANYDPMAKGASYMYKYEHGRDITGMHASAHHNTVLFDSEQSAVDASAQSMEEAGIELPENCTEDAAIDCVAKYVEAGCPVEYEDAGCADYAGCNADRSLCAEVAIAEGDGAAAMGLASGIRCDPAGRGDIGPNGECICDGGSRVIAVGIIGATVLYDTAPTTTEFGNAMPAYNTCVPDVAGSPRGLPHSSGPQGHKGVDAPPGGSTWGPMGTSYKDGVTYRPPGTIDRSDPYNGRRPSNPTYSGGDDAGIRTRPKEGEAEPEQEEGAEAADAGNSTGIAEEGNAAIATMVAATLLAAASL